MAHPLACEQSATREIVLEEVKKSIGDLLHHPTVLSVPAGAQELRSFRPWGQLRELQGSHSSCRMRHRPCTARPGRTKDREETSCCWYQLYPNRMWNAGTHHPPTLPGFEHRERELPRHHDVSASRPLIAASQSCCEMGLILLNLVVPAVWARALCVAAQSIGLKR